MLGAFEKIRHPCLVRKLPSVFVAHLAPPQRASRIVVVSVVWFTTPIGTLQLTSEWYLPGGQATASPYAGACVECSGGGVGRLVACGTPVERCCFSKAGYMHGSLVQNSAHQAPRAQPQAVFPHPPRQNGLHCGSNSCVQRVQHGSPFWRRIPAHWCRDGCCQWMVSSWHAPFAIISRLLSIFFLFSPLCSPLTDATCVSHSTCVG
jgi:hypothetical protein